MNGSPNNHSSTTLLALTWRQRLVAHALDEMLIWCVVFLNSLSLSLSPFAPRTFMPGGGWMEPVDVMDPFASGAPHHLALAFESADCKNNVRFLSFEISLHLMT